jgi:hypothetical protein
MLRLLKNKKAQNTIEYALIIAVVIGAFTVMQLYNRRAINMRVKKGMDNLPMAVISQEKMGGAETATPLIDVTGDSILGTKNDTQYEPYYYTGEYEMKTISTEGKEKAAFANDGGQRILTGRSSQRTGKQEISGTSQKD